MKFYIKSKIKTMTGMGITAGVLASCSSTQNQNMAEVTANNRFPAGLYDTLRGNPGEYDPGAPKDSKWVELYSSAPNYRQVGKAVLGGNDEKFRWEMGPMWYRGRLGENQVKAFVVGQEGAQDENVSNRAFTGSTGTKTQRFLNHIGVYRSYLFMNTFVYTINGQLDGDPKFAYLEQGEGVTDPELSPIVRYRHRLFDNMLVTNAGSISLFMGVGAGGKASLATWVNARGGKCSTSNNMAVCDTTGMRQFFAAGFKASYGEEIQANVTNEILVVGVPHPGGASAANGGAGALDNIINGFTRAAQKVAQFKGSKSSWLPHDQDDPLCAGVPSNKVCSNRIQAMNEKFDYKDAGIPYRDFAFGTNYRMGYDGTTSNRWGADSIQVFSKNGVYGDKSARYNMSRLGRQDQVESGVAAIGFKNNFDMPWEPPKFKSGQETSYDAGPCGDYDNYAFFTSQEHATAPCEFSSYLSSWPGVVDAQSPTFGPTSAYRGRLENAETLVIADQTSHDDFFSGRALTGEMGQKLQAWLNQNTTGSRYAILRTSGWDALNEDGKLNLQVLERGREHALKIARAVYRVGKTKRIVSVGFFAKQIAEQLASENQMKSQDLSSTVANLPIAAIPRGDLPYHTRWWMGTSGNRAIRGDGGELRGSKQGEYHYYRVSAPSWNRDYRVPRLDAASQALISSGLGELQ